MQIISSLLIIWRVAHGRAWSADTNAAVERSMRAARTTNTSFGFAGVGTGSQTVSTSTANVQQIKFNTSASSTECFEMPYVNKQELATAV